MPFCNRCKTRPNPPVGAVGHCKSGGQMFSCRHSGTWTAEEIRQFALDPPTQDTYDPGTDEVYLDDQDGNVVFLFDNIVYDDGVPFDDSAGSEGTLHSFLNQCLMGRP